MWHPAHHYDKMLIPASLTADTSYLVKVCTALSVQIPAAGEPGRKGWALEESKRVAAVLSTTPLPLVEFQPYVFFVGDLATYKSSLYQNMITCKLAMLQWNKVIEALQAYAHSKDHVDSVALIVLLEQTIEMLEAAPIIGKSVQNSQFAVLCGTLHDRGKSLGALSSIVRFYYQGIPIAAGMLQCKKYVKNDALLSKHASRMVDTWIDAAERSLKSPTVGVEVYTRNVRMCMAWADHIKPRPEPTQTAWIRVHSQAVSRHSVAASSQEAKEVQDTINLLLTKP